MKLTIENITSDTVIKTRELLYKMQEEFDKAATHEEYFNVSNTIELLNRFRYPNMIKSDTDDVKKLFYDNRSLFDNSYDLLLYHLNFHFFSVQRRVRTTMFFKRNTRIEIHINTEVNSDGIRDYEITTNSKSKKVPEYKAFIDKFVKLLDIEVIHI